MGEGAQAVVSKRRRQRRKNPRRDLGGGGTSRLQCWQSRDLSPGAHSRDAEAATGKPSAQRLDLDPACGGGALRRTLMRAMRRSASSLVELGGKAGRAWEPPLGPAASPGRNLWDTQRLGQRRPDACRG
jgi:hypothetical protein